MNIAKKVIALYYNTDFNLVKIVCNKTGTDKVEEISVDQLKQNILTDKNKIIAYENIEFGIFKDEKQRFYANVQYKDFSTYVTRGIPCKMIYDKPCPLEQKYGANKLVLKAVYYSDKHGGYYGAYIVTRAIFDVYENALDNSTKIDEIEIWSPELYRNLLVMNRKSVFAINSGILNLSYDNKCKIIVKKFDSMKKYADLVKEDPLMTSWRNKMTLSGNLDNYKIKGAILKEYTGNEKIISLPPITNITLTTFSKSMVEEVRLPRTLMTVDDSRLFDACMNRTAHIIKFDKTNVDPYYNTSKLTSLQKKLFTFSTDKDNTELELDNLQYEF